MSTWRAPRADAGKPVRFVIDPAEGLSIYDRSNERPFALAPDGRSIVFTAGADGRTFLRRLDRLSPVQVPGKLPYVTPTALRLATLDVSGATPRVVRSDSLFPNDFRDYTPSPSSDDLTVLRETAEGVKLVVVTNWLDEVMPKPRRAKAP